MKLAHDITLFADNQVRYTNYIGGTDIPTFLSTYNDHEVTPLLRGDDERSSAQVNPCYIDGRLTHLRSEATFWQEQGHYVFEYNYYIQPTDCPATHTIARGTPIETHAMRTLRGQYANIFFIGQNGGFDDAADLINQLQAMIDYADSPRYLVISYHKTNRVTPTIARMQDMEDSLHTAFGPHFINLRQYMTTQALRDAHLTPTPADADSIAHGQVPPQLLTDGTHFTPTGYQLIAGKVKEKFEEMGW